MRGNEGTGGLAITMANGRSHDALEVAQRYATRAQWQGIADSMDRAPAARAATDIVLAAARRHGSTAPAQEAIGLLLLGLRAVARSVNLEDFARADLFVAEAMQFADMLRDVRALVGAQTPNAYSAGAAAGEAGVLIAIVGAAGCGTMLGADGDAALPGMPAMTLSMALARADEALANAVESEDPADRRFGWYGRVQVALLTGRRAQAGLYAARLESAGTDGTVTPRMVQAVREQTAELEGHRQGGEGQEADAGRARKRRFF